MQGNFQLLETTLWILKSSLMTITLGYGKEKGKVLDIMEIVLIITSCRPIQGYSKNLGICTETVAQPASLNPSFCGYEERVGRQVRNCSDRTPHTPSLHRYLVGVLVGVELDRGSEKHPKPHLQSHHTDDSGNDGGV